MVKNVKQTPNPSASNPSASIRSLWANIKRWWNSLIDPKHYADEPVKNRLRRSRSLLVGLILFTVLCLMFWILGQKPHLFSFGSMMGLLLCVEEVHRMGATARSRVERETFEQHIGVVYRRISRVLLTVIVLSVLINEDVLGIGGILKQSFPWIEGVASHVISYINGFVSELVQSMHELIP